MLRVREDGRVSRDGRLSRPIWRYTGVGDLIVFLKAVVLSSVGSLMVVLFAFRFEGFSRTAFVIDGVLMFMFLAGSRLAFRLFRPDAARQWSDTMAVGF